jgi:hypothetical protein
MEATPFAIRHLGNIAFIIHLQTSPWDLNTIALVQSGCIERMTNAACLGNS